MIIDSEKIQLTTAYIEYSLFSDNFIGNYVLAIIYCSHRLFLIMIGMDDFVICSG